MREFTRVCPLCTFQEYPALIRPDVSDKRYTCVHLTCLGSSSIVPTFYPTWSALQHHIRTAHPPTCPHPSCNGRTFTQQKGLRAHMRLHEQREVEAELEASIADAGSDSDDGDHDSSPIAMPPRKRRRGGEVGRDWKCTEDGCDKDFKSVRFDRLFFFPRFFEKNDAHTSISRKRPLLPITTWRICIGATLCARIQAAVVPSVTSTFYSAIRRDYIPRGWTLTIQPPR
jgi:hypothetical protein